MIRVVVNLAQAAFLIVWSIFWISLAFLLALVTLNREVPLMMARRYWAPALIRVSGARLKVDSFPVFDWSKPHIFVMNHQSMLDIPIAFSVLPVNLHFIAKHNLKYVPFVGWYMWMTGMIFINRSQRSQAFKSIQRAAERVRNGANIIAYPEGTRSRTGDILPFKKGIFALALEAKVPIVPVLIRGSGDVVPPDGFCLRGGAVRVQVGQPIEVGDRAAGERDQLMREVHATMEKMLAG